MIDPPGRPGPDGRRTHTLADPPAFASEPATPGSLPEPLRPAARALFGGELDRAQRYADLLCTEGVLRGLIGPREAPRIWDRHLLNCAAMAELIPPDSRVVDVGSGAGLPGLVLAVARPDLTVILLEPLARRTIFLAEAIEDLGLEGSVRVLRGRAEECWPGGPLAGQLPPADIVTARAVAPLDRLVAWCLPLAAVGGRLLALKGASASDEVQTHRDAIRRSGGGEPVVRGCAAELLEQPATVVEIVREKRTGTDEGVPRSGGRGSAGSTRRRERSGRPER